MIPVLACRFQWGLVHAATLNGREWTGSVTASDSAIVDRHGRIAIAAPRRAVWMFGDPPAGLAEQIGRTGATFVNTGRDTFADLVVAQRFAVEAAAHHGLDPDVPRNLTRSVVLR
ncbi:hypothetical protein [Plantactinospora sp. BB1]|uniref:hypothetical protein n=1 Tax=Plantactinospora sp. BB1 TaxID=2071627 RepID=UPI00131F1408|nr:hypothetical protein [Plantactinospora sp. BB1]